MLFSLSWYSSLPLLLLITVWAYGAMETHQTSDLRIAGSIPAMLVFFLPFFFLLVYLILPSPFLSLNGNVAQSVERKSHNLKVVSSILTVPTFFAFCSFPFPRYSSLPLLLLITVWAYGAMETHQTSDLRIAGSIPAMLVFFRTFLPEFLSCRVPYRLSILFFFERERSSVGRA